MSSVTGKMQRGLADISDLFQGKLRTPNPSMAPYAEEPYLKTLAVLCPGYPAITSVLAEFIAQCLYERSDVLWSVYTKFRAPMTCTHEIKRVDQSLGKCQSQMTISHQEFCQYQKGLTASQENALPGNTIVSLDMSNLSDEEIEKLSLFTDQMILYVRPSLESISESYRWIKRANAINKNIEFYLIEDMEPLSKSSAELFEGLSKMVSGRLCSQLMMLGCLQFMHLRQGVCPHLRLENFFLSDSKKTLMSPEKLALRQMLSQRHGREHAIAS